MHLCYMMVYGKFVIELRTFHLTLKCYATYVSLNQFNNTLTTICQISFKFFENLPNWVLTIFPVNSAMFICLSVYFSARLSKHS